MSGQLIYAVFALSFINSSKVSSKSLHILPLQLGLKKLTDPHKFGYKYEQSTCFGP